VADGLDDFARPIQPLAFGVEPGKLELEHVLSDVGWLPIAGVGGGRGLVGLKRQPFEARPQLLLGTVAVLEQGAEFILGGIRLGRALGLGLGQRQFTMVNNLL
jgi:hypothetical protein